MIMMTTTQMMIIIADNKKLSYRRETARQLHSLKLLFSRYTH